MPPVVPTLGELCMHKIADLVASELELSEYSRTQGHFEQPLNAVEALSCLPTDAACTVCTCFCIPVAFGHHHPRTTRE